MTISTPVPARRKRLRSAMTRERLTGLVWQIVVVGLAIAVVGWLWSNAIHNLSVRRIATGFAFLGREAGMPIADAWIDYSPKNTYLRAFIVGLVNTLRVAVIGIVLATVLGTIVGIARLSSNWLLSRLAAVYVEVLRDLPLLLQLLFWYVLMQGLPVARAAWMPIDGVYLSNRGLILPSIPIEHGHLWVIGYGRGRADRLICAEPATGRTAAAGRPAASPLALRAGSGARIAGAAVVGLKRILDHHFA